MPSYPQINDAKEYMPPPPTPADDAVTRSASSASRNTNRLSITLPIAPPTSDPTRPISANSAYPSLPGTSARPTLSSVTSPASANELIITIAAQEHRVIELREELGRAEDDLKRVKRQWTLHKAYKKPGEQVRGTGEQGVPGDDEGARWSTDHDRRRILLQQQGATRERKRVFQGRHARTLSLLSPTKPADKAFPVLENRDVERAVQDPDPQMVQMDREVLSHSIDSQFFKHLLTYPVVKEGVSAFQDSQLGQLSIQLGDAAYRRLAEPVAQFLRKPYQYIFPYIKRADQVAEQTLSRVDGRFPVFKKPTNELYTDTKNLMLFPYHKGLEGKEHVLKAYSAEFKRLGGGSLLAYSRALVDAVFNIGGLLWIRLGREERMRRTWSTEKLAKPRGTGLGSQIATTETRARRR